MFPAPRRRHEPRAAGDGAQDDTAARARREVAPAGAAVGLGRGAPGGPRAGEHVRQRLAAQRRHHRAEGEGPAEDDLRAVAHGPRLAVRDDLPVNDESPSPAQVAHLHTCAAWRDADLAEPLPDAQAQEPDAVVLATANPDGWALGQEVQQPPCQRDVVGDVQQVRRVRSDALLQAVAAAVVQHATDREGHAQGLEKFPAFVRLHLARLTPTGGVEARLHAPNRMLDGFGFALQAPCILALDRGLQCFFSEALDLRPHRLQQQVALGDLLLVLHGRRLDLLHRRGEAQCAQRLLRAVGGG
mmetsp:Transcript_17587/g.61481  ORF Transcript_17587/g.61481 Transcript_17587/m.61481 type:complete len:300 (-) Transcript_17587:1028-1927(-)